MQICVCGWYYNPDLYGKLKGCPHPVYVVAHRKHELLDGFDHYVRRNRGLEFGAYDWFLQLKWDGISSVVFQHDDVRIDSAAIYDRILLKAGDVDHLYLFGNPDEIGFNKGIHGRMLYCSPKLLQMILDEHDGIWWDKENTGNVDNPKPESGHPYNEAILRFNDMLSWFNGECMVGGAAIIPGLECAVRNDFDFLKGARHNEK